MLGWLAMTLVAMAAEPCPAEADLAVERASTYWEAGALMEAKLAAAAADTLCPNNSDIMYLSFALNAWGERDEVEARAWLERMLAVDACDRRALGWRSILNDRIDPDASRADALQAVSCLPSHLGAWSALDRSQRSVGGTTFRPIVNPKARVRSDEGEWQAHLAAAREAGMEQEALYAHTLSDAQLPEYRAWREANPGAMERYLETMVAVVPTPPKTPTR